MTQRKVVMISSTGRDLPKRREQVRLACERAGFEPREMMENLTAENRNAVETSLRMVEQADIYLVIAYLQLRDHVGRQAELNVLTDWVANAGSIVFNARIFCFVAIGGMGKSALTRKWFNQIAPNEMKRLSGVYESDSTFENVLIRALCYVSGNS